MDADENVTVRTQYKIKRKTCDCAVNIIIQPEERTYRVTIFIRRRQTVIRRYHSGIYTTRE
jgi:hypothetical protein